MTKPVTKPVFLGVRIDPEQLAAIKAQAARTAATMSDVVRQAVAQQLQTPPEVNG